MKTGTTPKLHGLKLPNQLILNLKINSEDYNLCFKCTEELSTLEIAILPRAHRLNYFKVMKFYT